MLCRIAIVVFATFLAARPLAACSAKSWDPNELVENEVVCSANGRFCVVVRWYEGVADFSSERAGKVFDFDVDKFDIEEDREPPEPRTTVTAALYESRRLIAEFPLDVRSFNDVLVSDSGQFLVAIRHFSGGLCGSYADADDAIVTIHSAAGSHVGAVKAGDVFEPYDIHQLTNIGRASVSFALRHESDTREVVVLSIRAPGDVNGPRYEERRIDLATAALLDPRRAIYPTPRAYATPIDDRWVMRREYADPPPDCAEAWNADDIVRIDSARLFAEAVYGPAPPFPDILFKARVRGTVQVDVLVSEGGDVLCTRATQFPFGATAAAAEAMRRWRFRPFLIDGHAVKFAGELLYHFQDVDEATWAELMRNAPPVE